MAVESTMTRTPDEDTTLAQVAQYVENKGIKFRDVLDRAEWDTLEDPDKELICFRLKDKSTLPSHGISIAVDMDSVRFFEPAQLIRVIGDQMIVFLEQGLPVKESGQPYTTQVIYPS